MRTQRVNAYRAGGNIIYFIEENNSRSADWVTVGDVSQNYDVIASQVGHFNMREIIKNLEGDRK